MCDTSTGLTLFVKAAKDGKSLGACPQSQRVLMLAELKAAGSSLPKFQTVPVNISRPPEAFSRLGLRLRVPALYLGSNEDPVDVADEIVTILEERFPGGVQQTNQDPEAELATRDFFSRFCFLIRDVSKDAHHLETELRRMDHYLIESGYEIPASLTGLWRYLHAAYSEPAFIKTCPSDAEILLHWYEHIGETPANIRKHLVHIEKSPRYSFSVPVFAKPVILE
ncbi:hypothetical protein C0J52_15974 [Blattella germanica]|nr:hypothetical protein C0J52_15974 [Blattella germanica]